MILAEPQPFLEALRSQLARALLPTDLDTEQLARLSPALRRRAMFSAQVTDLEQLDELASGISDMLAGRLDRATVRARIKGHLARHGYRPTPGEEGTLKDFSSDARINTQLDTNVQMMQGLGNHIQGQEPAVLDMYPARELVRVRDARVPREWRERWNAARAATLAEGATDAGSGRMIALVGHPIWREISRFGNEFPPFDFGSGMGLRDVSRREAMRLRLIGRDTQIPRGEPPAPDADVQARPALRDARLRAALEAARDAEGRPIGRFDQAGVYRLVTDDGGAA